MGETSMKQDVKLDMSERHELQRQGDKVITPVAAAAARAVFDACGGAEGWKNWIVPDGKMTKFAYVVMPAFLGQNPNASAEAVYIELRRCCSREHAAWAEAPMPVRGAYKAFHGVYREFWRAIRAHDPKMAQALAWRPPPRLVEAPRYLPKLSPDDVVELQEKLAQLGYTEREIKYRLTDPCFKDCTRDRVLWDAEEMACYRVWSDEQAVKNGGKPLCPQHQMRPDRPYLQALYDEWKAYWANARVRDRKSWVHTGLPSGRG